ncbi:MAG: uroporphyrinogen-III synthase, partial [Candidatus Hadarchaeum sp.]
KEHKLIAVGETTRRELEQHGCKHVLIPPIQNLDGIRKLLKEKKLGRVLAFRSPLAKEKLDGATNVIAYRVEPKNLDSTIRAYLKTKSDFTILTSSGLLECLLKAADRLGLKKRFVGKMNRSFVISLGSSITKFALENGINVCYEPQEPNLESLFHGD